MKLYYTADVDRDVNIRVTDSEAGSIDRGAGTAARFSSSEKGLRAILDMLDSLGIKGTLFFEGKTAEIIDCSSVSGHAIGVHGYEHETLTALEPESVERIMRKSVEAVSDNVGKPACFRAPFMLADRTVLDSAESVGIRVDSSFYADWEPPSSGLREYPVSVGRDSGGKRITGYLWPMHEGVRPAEDFVKMAENAAGDIVLADHSWHMVETRSGGVMDSAVAEQQAEAVRRVLEGIIDLGYIPAVMR